MSTTSASHRRYMSTSAECQEPAIRTESVGQTRKTRRESFSQCTVHCHAPALDASKLPDGGQAPLGLGAVVGTEVFTVDAFEAARVHERRFKRSLLVGAGERKKRLADTPTEELEAVVRYTREVL